MLKKVREHYYVSDEAREFLEIVKVLKTPYIIPTGLAVILVYCIVSLAIVFFG